MKVEAQGGEPIFINSAKDIVIFPKHLRNTVLKHLQNSNYKAIDDIAESLPYMDDYAEDGTLVAGDPPVGKGITPLKLDSGLRRQAYSNTVAPTDKSVDENVIADSKSTVTVKGPYTDFDPENILYKQIAENETYESSGKRKASLDEIEMVKNRYKGIYGDKVPLNELAVIAESSKKRAEGMYPLYTEANKKEAEFSNTDFTKQVDESIQHYKTNYGKTDKNFYNVESDIEGFKNTPINRTIYNKIVDAAKNIGIDKYTALGLAMVESNYGKGYRDKNAGTIYESSIFSNFDGKVWQGSKDLDMNKGYTSAVLDYVRNKGLDFTSMTEEQKAAAIKEFQTELKSSHPLAKTGTEAALMYYKKNPSGYNSGNKKYVQTVELAANTLRKQKDKLEAWEKQ